MGDIKTSEKKEKYNRKIWAMLTNKQAGKSMAVIEKVFKNLHEDLDSDNDFRRNNASNLALKIYTHLAPKQSGPLVQINNNTQINNSKGGDVILGLKEFLIERSKKTEAIEQREDNRKLEIKQKAVKTVTLPKLPANSPLNKAVK